MRRQAILLLAVVVMASVPANTTRADEYTHWIGTTGDWFELNNWQDKVPEFGDDAFINNGGTAEILYGSAETYNVDLGRYGGNSGTIDHTGGSLNISNILYMGYGGGSGTYYLGGTGQLISNWGIHVGSGGIGTFNQAGGSASSHSTNVAVTGIGLYEHSGGIHSNEILRVGNFVGSQGSYNLSGSGQLITNNTQIIGRQNGSKGTFNQTGGTNTVHGTLVLGEEVGADGRYTISGGALSAQELQVGYQGTGRFDIDSSAASITVSDELFFGADSIFTAVTNSTIRIKGSLDNWNTDETDLAGFNNLSLIFEDGATTDTETFEVAGEDLGATRSGFDENFALDTLMLGEDAISILQLVDWRDNATGVEALYVSDLIIGNGSYLDLNGLNLYCLNYMNYGGTVALNGGHIEVVPVPGAVLLGSIGLGMVGWLWRKGDRNAV